MAIVVAADAENVMLDGMPVARRSVEFFSCSAEIDRVLVVDSLRATRSSLSTCDSSAVVVVHDADRIPVTVAIAELVGAVRTGADAAVIAAEVTETVKAVGVNNVITETVPRETLVRLDAPQAYRAAVLTELVAASPDAVVGALPHLAVQAGHVVARL